MKEREKRRKNVADNLYLSYERIRENARNGLAVVNVKRNACGGCFNIVPPQRQVDIKERKKAHISFTTVLYILGAPTVTIDAPN